MKIFLQLITRRHVTSLKFFLLIPFLITLVVKLNREEIANDKQRNNQAQPEQTDANSFNLNLHLQSINYRTQIFNNHFISNESFNNTIILVQVSKRKLYLKYLIESLAEVSGIDKTLLIFSHDHYTSEFNELVGSIKFAAYMQIFYPFSLQLFANKYPGLDVNDCAVRGLSKLQALVSKCNNAKYPDTYGNYRDYEIVQIKLHWIWKLTFVYEKLFNEKQLNVLLLEDDYFLAPDALHMLERLKEKIETKMDIISLGFFDQRKQNLNFEQNANKYGRALFNSGNHNTGLHITRTIWNYLKDCSNEFCTYDDYNWDFTLQFIGQSCLKSTFYSIFPIASRVIHMGECGTHHKGTNCDAHEKYRQIKEILANKKQSEKLFSNVSLELKIKSKFLFKLKKSNGGWSDLRDHMLCKSFVNNINEQKIFNLTI